MLLEQERTGSTNIILSIHFALPTDLFFLQTYCDIFIKH